MIQTSPSPIITPTLPPEFAGMPTTTTPSGLIVVRSELTPVSKGSQLVLSDAPLTGDAALEAAKTAYAELAARSGPVAAGIVHGAQLALVQRIRDDELRSQAVAALLAGDLSRAAQLISRAG